MPEEEKPELETNRRFVKEIYIDSEVVDKFWIQDSISGYGKPAKGMLGNLILNNCDEKVLLLMGSDCSTEDFMEGEVISDGSDAVSFDDETIMRPMVLRKELDDDDDFVAKLSDGEEHEGENTFCQDASKKTEVANPMASSVIGESKSQDEKTLGGYLADKLQDNENENMVSSKIQVQESANIIQQFSGGIPFSGSISHRSTSSTASTQSFAFPILAQEWNSSPVRMVQPEKSQLRKKRRWRIAMSRICCRF